MSYYSEHAYEPVDEADMPSVETPEDESVQERDWYRLEVAAQEFKERYGAAAMLRCVSRALEVR